MRIVSLTAGSSRSAAASSNGHAWVWGNVGRRMPAGPDGQPASLCGPSAVEIGHARYAQPAPQRLRPLDEVSAVADASGCLFALGSDARLMACGLVAREDGAIPAAPVAGLSRPVRSVAASDTATAVLLANGDIVTWGFNAFGQLGREAPLRGAAPAKVLGLPPGSAVVAGSNHFLALDRLGRVWSWGANASGQLGHGDLSPSRLPRQVDLPSPITAIAAGDTHSLAIDDRGRAWGWGSHHKGQLAGAPESGVKHHRRPVALALGFAVAALDGGMHYSVALSREGDVFTWGWNGTGQLAAEGVSATSKPIRVAGLRNADKLAAGPGHVLAARGSALFAWGDNRTGACGRSPDTPVMHSVVQIPIA